MVLPRYKGPISRSLTDLFRFNATGGGWRLLLAGGGANLSGLSVPSACFSPAKIALSLLNASKRFDRRKWNTRNVMIAMTKIAARDMPTARPTVAPVLLPRFESDRKEPMG